MFHHRIEIFMGFMWLVGFQMLNASLVIMVLGRDTIEPLPKIDCYCLRKNSMCCMKSTIIIEFEHHRDQVETLHRELLDEVKTLGPHYPISLTQLLVRNLRFSFL